MTVFLGYFWMPIYLLKEIIWIQNEQIPNVEPIFSYQQLDEHTQLTQHSIEMS
jgi:hypothetical protein